METHLHRWVFLTNAFYTINNDTSNESNGQFCIGQDFERFSGKSGTILSGISMLGNALLFSSNYIPTSFTDSAVFDFFVHCDMKLIIRDGKLASTGSTLNKILQSTESLTLTARNINGRVNASPAKITVWVLET